MSNENKAHAYLDATDSSSRGLNSVKSNFKKTKSPKAHDKLEAKISPIVKLLREFYTITHIQSLKQTTLNFRTADHVLELEKLEKFINLIPPFRVNENIEALELHSLKRTKPVGGGCFSGDSTVTLIDGQHELSREIQTLRQGNFIKASDGSRVKVKCVIKIKQPPEGVKLIQICKGLYITLNHPMFINNKWVLPTTVSWDQRLDTSGYLYCLIVEGNPVIPFGIDKRCCVTWAHNLQEEGVKHEYYGTKAIEEDLMALDGWEQGFVEISYKCLQLLKQKTRIISGKNATIQQLNDDFEEEKSEMISQSNSRLSELENTINSSSQMIQEERRRQTHQGRTSLKLDPGRSRHLSKVQQYLKQRVFDEMHQEPDVDAYLQNYTQALENEKLPLREKFMDEVKQKNYLVSTSKARMSMRKNEEGLLKFFKSRKPLEDCSGESENDQPEEELTNNSKVSIAEDMKNTSQGIYFAELDLGLLQLDYPFYEEPKDDEWPIIKNHYPSEEDLKSAFQVAEENFALLIGLSKYKSFGDEEYADLNCAKNDVIALKNLLKKSHCQFNPENITLLIDPDFEEIKRAMSQLKRRAKEQGDRKNKATTIFFGASCHGASLNDGQLHLVLPTSLKEKEYAKKLKIELAKEFYSKSLKSLLEDFERQRSQIKDSYFDEKALDIKSWIKSDSNILKNNGLTEVSQNLDNIKKQILQVAGLVIQKIKKKDPMKILNSNICTKFNEQLSLAVQVQMANQLAPSESTLPSELILLAQEAKKYKKKIEKIQTKFLVEFVQQDSNKFEESNLQLVIEKTLMFVYRKHQKFINIDKYIKSLGMFKNVQLLSFFDCCRQKVEKKGKGNGHLIDSQGQFFTFYAKEDGGLASDGNKDDLLSPTTSALVYYLKGNPGAKYPQVLDDFQFKVFNRCELRNSTTRGIILVAPNNRKWTNEEMLGGLNKQIETLFPKELMPQFYNAANEAFSQGKFTKHFVDIDELYQNKQALKPIENELDDLQKKGEIGNEVQKYLIQNNARIYQEPIPDPSKKNEVFRKHKPDKEPEFQTSQSMSKQQRLERLLPIVEQMFDSYSFHSKKRNKINTERKIMPPTFIEYARDINKELFEIESADETPETYQKVLEKMQKINKKGLEEAYNDTIFKKDFMAYYEELLQNQFSVGCMLITNYVTAFIRKFNPKKLPKKAKSDLQINQKVRSWFETGGCHIQAEFNTNQELHGRAVVIMPGCFILATTFNKNEILPNEYSQNNQDLSYVRTKQNYFLMVAGKDGEVSYSDINGLPPLFKDEKLNLNPFYVSNQFVIQSSAVQASTVLGPKAFKQCLNLEQYIQDQDGLSENELLQQAVIELYSELEGTAIKPWDLGQESNTFECLRDRRLNYEQISQFKIQEFIVKFICETDNNFEQLIHEIDSRFVQHADKCPEEWLQLIEFVRQERDKGTKPLILHNQLCYYFFQQYGQMLMQIYFCSSKNKTPIEVHNEEKWFDCQDQEVRDKMIKQLGMQQCYRILHWNSCFRGEEKIHPEFENSTFKYIREYQFAFQKRIRKAVSDYAWQQGYCQKHEIGGVSVQGSFSQQKMLNGVALVIVPGYHIDLLFVKDNKLRDYIQYDPTKKQPTKGLLEIDNFLKNENTEINSAYFHNINFYKLQFQSLKNKAEAMLQDQFLPFANEINLRANRSIDNTVKAHISLRTEEKEFNSGRAIYQGESREGEWNGKVVCLKTGGYLFYEGTNNNQLLESSGTWKDANEYILIKKAHKVLQKGVKGHPVLKPGLGLLEKVRFKELYRKVCYEGKFCFYEEDNLQGEPKKLTKFFKQQSSGDYVKLDQNTNQDILESFVFGEINAQGQFDGRAIEIVGLTFSFARFKNGMMHGKIFNMDFDGTASIQEYAEGEQVGNKIVLVF